MLKEQLAWWESSKVGTGPEIKALAFRGYSEKTPLYALLHADHIEVGIPYHIVNEAGWFDESYRLPLTEKEMLEVLALEAKTPTEAAYAWLKHCEKAGVKQ